MGLRDAAEDGDALGRAQGEGLTLKELLELPLDDVFTEGVAGADVTMGVRVGVARELGDRAAEDAAPVALIETLCDALCDTDKKGLALDDGRDDRVA